MGKKKKNNPTGSEAHISDIQTNKKRKHSNSEASNADINEPVQEVKNKQNKNNVTNDAKQDLEVTSKHINKTDKHLDAINVDVTLVSGPTKVKRKKKDKNINASVDAMPKNKKIVFKDDGQIENSYQKSKNENSNQKPFLSGEEAAVTEEEIDRFCDELNEEDNLQFDSWVKLIEEKLNPIRKNKTT